MNKFADFPKLITIYVAIHLPVFAAVCLYLGTALIMPLVLQSVLAVIAFGGLKLSSSNKPLGDGLIATSIALTPAVLVFVLSGHPWQIDAHMYFFAVVAMLVGFYSYEAVLAGATAIALHHLVLNFALPYAVFPEGTDFWRVVFHAVIVVVEVVVVLHIIHGLKISEKRIEAEVKNAQEALEQVKEARKQQEVMAARASEEQKETRLKVAKQFREQVGETLMLLEDCVAQVHDVAVEVSSAVKEANDNSALVSKVSDSTATNVQTISEAVEMLSNSMYEIAGEVSAAADTTKLCTQSAQASQENLSHLQAAVAEIESVIQGINEVAEQTNLLALNATIEAARAGEAGKGFAVVAGEVKSLANETHKMTEEVSAKVNDIRSSAEDTISTVKKIIDQISGINEKTNVISVAVEEQKNSTGHIGANIQEAARGTSEVSSNIMQVRSSTDKTSACSTELSNAAQQLTAQTQILKTAISDFIKEIETD